MFATLLASRPVRQQSARGFATSVALHGVLFGGAVYATLGRMPAIPRPLPQHIVPYAPPDPPEIPRTPPSHPPQLPPGPPVVGDMFPPPIPFPTLPDAPTRSLADLLPSGTPLVPGGSTGVADPGPAPGQPYLADQVEITVAIEKGSPLPRFPTALRFTGIEGTARFRFVVDTLGRVEMATVEQLQSSHDAFGFAVRQTLQRMRFRPAQVGGQAVRQLVEFPVIFRVTR